MTKVLIVSLDNLGDTIISLAVYDAVNRIPGFKAAIWTKNYASGIISLLPTPVAHYHCDPFWDRSPGTGKGALAPFLRTLREIRKEKFDSAIILHSNWRKNLSCLLANIRTRHGAKGAFLNRISAVKQDGRHVLDVARSLIIEATKVDPGPLRYSIPSSIDPDSDSLKVLFSKGDWAVIHPFSGNPKRNLPIHRWAKVSAHLIQRGMRIFVNASPNEKQIFLNAVPEDGLSFSCDNSHTLRSLAYAISKARIFIGNNSGPLHLASALGTPCVGIYEDREVTKIAPLGRTLPRLNIFSHTPEEISAEMVIQEIDSALSSPI